MPKYTYMFYNNDNYSKIIVFLLSRPFSIHNVLSTFKNLCCKKFVTVVASQCFIHIVELKGVIVTTGTVNTNSDNTNYETISNIVNNTVNTTEGNVMNSEIGMTHSKSRSGVTTKMVKTVNSKIDLVCTNTVGKIQRKLKRIQNHKVFQKNFYGQ